MHILKCLVLLIKSSALVISIIKLIVYDNKVEPEISVYAHQNIC